MGGHAAYVWSAYGFSLVVLVISVWAARRKRLDALAQARQVGLEEPSSGRARVTQVE
jgi:heme exporter protein CcmD